ncbi:hypothetical protein SAMN05421640_1134 [Ekhidna lutea]|uniref:Uncharacterized protein n=1 Tax=Ekhidna lutea TaxID=447679 RepID=A0A239H439_EKHLU|nr:hypothetical protein [Ekhidna lutea]SNS76169.1 hypothetical protein SAMN05421640_1134 [Ekhidna lutea]
MDDFSFWWYIIAAVIYFLTRGKKKQQPNSRPGSENSPPPSQPKSFEDLLKEITEGRSEPETPTYEQEPVEIEPVKEREKQDDRLEGERRAFADDESKRVYEESIKMAEGADLKFEPADQFKKGSLFKGSIDEEDEWTIADEIKDGLNSSEAKKAVIYSEILNRKY